MNTSPSQREYLEEISSFEAELQEVKVFDADFQVQALHNPN